MLQIPPTTIQAYPTAPEAQPLTMPVMPFTVIPVMPATPLDTVAVATAQQAQMVLQPLIDLTFPVSLPKPLSPPTISLNDQEFMRFMKDMYNPLIAWVWNHSRCRKDPLSITIDWLWIQQNFYEQTYSIYDSRLLQIYKWSILHKASCSLGVAYYPDWNMLSKYLVPYRLNPQTVLGSMATQPSRTLSPYPLLQTIRTQDSFQEQESSAVTKKRKFQTSDSNQSLAKKAKIVISRTKTAEPELSEPLSPHSQQKEEEIQRLQALQRGAKLRQIANFLLHTQPLLPEDVLQIPIDWDFVCDLTLAYTVPSIHLAPRRPSLPPPPSPFISWSNLI